MKLRSGDPPLEPRRRPAAEAAQADAVDTALARAGDRGAFERLYRRHADRVYGLAVRMAGHGEAEELTQEIFVRVWTKIGSFRGESAFGTWVFRLGVNTILSHRAKMGRHRDRFVQDPEDEIAERTPAPSGAREKTLDLADLERAMVTLPERARDVFVLHDVEGFKHEEIASMLSINVGTSKSQLHRARMLLRKALAA